VLAQQATTDGGGAIAARAVGIRPALECPVAPTCDASVLICTRNRAASLRTTLDSLTALRIPDGTAWEVVVADNGSTDDTAAVIEGFADRLPIRRLAEPRPGLSRARNAALRAARGAVLLFTDDDCRVAPDWLATALQLLADQPLQLLGGRIELFDPDALPLAVRSTPDRAVLASYSDIIGFLHGANLAFRRGLTDAIGAFDERLGAGSPTKSAEDADLVYRALRAGIPVVYEPALFVRHDHGRKGRATWYSQVGDHAQGFGGMLIKYLVKGDLRPARVAYWDFMSTLHMVRRDRREWPRVLAKLRTLNGVITYFVRPL